MSKPQAENEATRIPQPGAERGPELERQIIALVDFIEEILKTEKSRLLQVAGLAALEIGSTLQWDYEENGKLQDKIVLKFEGKKKICTSSSSLEKALSSASKYLPSESTDHGEPELHNAAKSSEFEQLTAGLIRERNIIGITDNQD